MIIKEAYPEQRAGFKLMLLSNANYLGPFGFSPHRSGKYSAGFPDPTLRSSRLWASERVCWHSQVES